MKLKCSVCKKKLSTIYTARQHIRIFHPEKADELIPKKIYNFRCQDCDKRYSHLRNLKYHRRKVHSDGELVVHAPKKKCPICNYCGSKVQELTEHFTNIHKIHLKTSFHNFSCTTKFTVWKEAIENETKAYFVKYTGTRILSSSQKDCHYVCHRSGTFNSKSKGIRLLKSQGSNKINGFCPAGMKVIVGQNGSCKVTFCETHVGHENDLNHLLLNSSDKEKLADQIAKDVSFCTILKEVHNSQQKSQSERMCLLNRSDLHNIKKKLTSTANKASKKEQLEATRGEDEHIECDLVIDSNSWMESGEPLEDHDYVPRRKMNFESNLSLSEEKKIIKASLTKLVSSISTMEEIEAMKKMIATIQSTLLNVRKKNVEVKLESMA